MWGREGGGAPLRSSFGPTSSHDLTNVIYQVVARKEGASGAPLLAPSFLDAGHLPDHLLLIGLGRNQPGLKQRLIPQS